MKDCCESKASELVELRKTQGRTLKIVLWINLLMFFLELTFGILSKSSALLADSLDMLGDAAVYGFSLYVLHRSPLLRARAAMMKGSIMLFSAVAVSAELVRRALGHEIPLADMMGAMGGVALAANAFCAFLLFRHRSDDANLRSTWLCSRNDVIANLGVIAAAVFVHFTDSRWPDTIVGIIIAGLFLTSAFSVFKDAIAESRIANRNV